MKTKLNEHAIREIISQQLIGKNVSLLEETYVKSSSRRLNSIFIYKGPLMQIDIKEIVKKKTKEPKTREFKFSCQQTNTSVILQEEKLMGRIKKEHKNKDFLIGSTLIDDNLIVFMSVINETAISYSGKNSYFIEKTPKPEKISIKSIN